MSAPRLWHFTCDHGYSGIGKRGMLRPNPHVLIPQFDAMVWLTCDGRPSRDDVGLTSARLSCDRMAYRYRVIIDDPVRYLAVADRIDRNVRDDLERFGMPETWWLSFDPVLAVLA